MDSIIRVMVKQTEGICFQFFFFLYRFKTQPNEQGRHIEGKCKTMSCTYVKVILIKPELTFFDLLHCRTSLRINLLQKGVFTDEEGHVCKLIQNTLDSSQHTKKRSKNRAIQVLDLLQLDRKHKASAFLITLLVQAWT